MTKPQIKKWYIVLAIANLILTLIGYFLAYGEDQKIRLAVFAASNIGFHLIYFIVAFGCKAYINYILSLGSRGLPNKFPLFRFPLRSYARIWIAQGIIFCVVILIIPNDGYPQSHFSALAPCGMILAGYKLLNHINYELGNR